MFDMLDIFSRCGRSRLFVLGPVVVALIALLTGCEAPRGEIPTIGVSPQADEPRARIVFLGDSLAAGYGLAEADAFPALIGERLQRDGYAVEIVNAGVSGDTSAGGLSRADWVLRSGPDLLVIELGGNDALRGQPLEQIESNLREIARRGLAAGARVLLLGMNAPTSYGSEYVDEFVGLYARVAGEEKVDFVPEFIREVALDPTLMQPDGLHPTAEGHRRLAESLLPAIRAALAESLDPADRGSGE